MMRLGRSEAAFAWVLLAAILARPAAAASFEATQAPIPAAMAERMRAHSWHQGCPVAIGELAYLRLSHWGSDGKIHQGELVVHRAIASEVVGIFKALFEQKFVVEKMRLVDDYDGDDDRSVADNNTSGFNCRAVAGKPTVLSQHSYGRAIDINPLWNPMVEGDKVAPPAGMAFLDGKKSAPGLLRKGDKAVGEFTRRGWTWGGDWVSMKDYQHFQK